MNKKSVQPAAQCAAHTYVPPWLCCVSHCAHRLLCWVNTSQIKRDCWAADDVLTHFTFRLHHKNISCFNTFRQWIHPFPTSCGSAASEHHWTGWLCMSLTDWGSASVVTTLSEAYWERLFIFPVLTASQTEESNIFKLVLKIRILVYGTITKIIYNTVCLHIG